MLVGLSIIIRFSMSRENLHKCNYRQKLWVFVGNISSYILLKPAAFFLHLEDLKLHFPTLRKKGNSSTRLNTNKSYSLALMSAYARA